MTFRSPRGSFGSPVVWTGIPKQQRRRVIPEVMQMTIFLFLNSYKKWVLVSIGKHNQHIKPVIPWLLSRDESKIDNRKPILGTHKYWQNEKEQKSWQWCPVTLEKQLLCLSCLLQGLQRDAGAELGEASVMRTLCGQRSLMGVGKGGCPEELLFRYSSPCTFPSNFQTSEFIVNQFLQALKGHIFCKK